MSATAFEAAIVRGKPIAWFEMHAAIRGKNRETITGPKANKMQREAGEIIQLCADLGIPARIVTLKGRQEGSSTIAVAIIYHMMRQRPVKACIIGDEYEKSVKNLEAMLEFYAAHDSFDWESTYNPPSGKFSNGSELVTETANDPRAGASGTMQAVLATEVAHWKETGKTSAKQTFAALLNCVPETPETLVIVESTPNGVGGVYYTTYASAVSVADYKAGRIPRNWNGFFKIFYPWHEHPEYLISVTTDQEQELLANLSERETELVEMGLTPAHLAWRRNILASPRFAGDEELFEQEYPSDEVRCFLLSGRRAFAERSVTAMRKAAEEQPGPQFGTLRWSNQEETAAAFEVAPEDEAFCKIWETARHGCAYWLVVDPMTGASQTEGADPDNHGIGVWRAGFFENDGVWNPPALVARLADCFAEKRQALSLPVCRWDIDLVEVRVAQLAKIYGNCPIVVELNKDTGLVELLKARGGMEIYRRIIYNRVRQEQTEAFGWMTTIKTRPAMIEMVRVAVRNFGKSGEGLNIRDLPSIREFDGFVINADGKESAMSGFHDDQVLMTAIALMTKDCAKTFLLPRRSRRSLDWDDADMALDQTFS